MRALHLYFRLHRPYKLNSVAEFDKGYFGGEAEFREANRLEYQPFLALLERNAQRHKGLKISLGVSGIWLEQAKQWDPELLRRLKRLVEREKVEILAMPFDYSLAWFYDPDEFAAQMAEFQTQARVLLGAECQVAAMPELIYHDKLGAWAETAGFAGMLAGAAEQALDYRSPNRVYEAATGRDAPERLRLLFQNTRFSRAIREMTDLATAERPRAKEDFGEEGAMEASADRAPLAGVNGGGANVRRHKTTAAEFVRGMAQGARTEAVERAAPAAEVENERVFSALKFQKELELECLRGDLVNIALGTEIFRQWRDAGIVRFFDELFASWLNNANHRLVNATEALNWGAVGPEVAITATVDWCEGAANRAGLARLADVRYCPPERLSEPAQIKLEKSLYALKNDVLKTKDKELYRIFGRLTDLSYLMALRAPATTDTEDWYNDGAKSYAERVEAVWQSFAEQVTQKLPQPAKLAAKADGKTAPIAEEEDFAVKVRRIPSQKAAPAAKKRVPAAEQASATGQASAAGQALAANGASAAGQALAAKKTPVRRIMVEEAKDWDDLVWGDDWGEVLERVEPAADEMAEADEEVEALARQLSRKKEAMEQNLTELAEAEVISLIAKPTTKETPAGMSGEATPAPGMSAEATPAPAAAVKKKRTHKKLVIE